MGLWGVRTLAVTGAGGPVEVAPISNDLLFYPPSATVTAPPRECLSAAPHFEGRAGVYVAGATSPAVAGAAVAVTVKGSGR
eukprot:7764888-Pyramimonas_sp.AAC.2